MRISQKLFSAAEASFAHAIPRKETLTAVQNNIKKTTFYRRELPASLISFTSLEGKQIFRDSMLSGYAENYFPLVGNFTTQSEPSYCGLGSLAMVLNALEIDPGKQWKGVWRWYTDDNLECCSADANHVKKHGITFREFSCLAKCNGLSVTSKRIDTVSKETFIEDLKTVCSSSDMHMVVSFSRKTLGQTGDGHFSPIGSYHGSKSMALVLDTARFKYPSYYAPIDLLYEAMKPVDKETGLPRGYFILSRDSKRQKYYKPLSLCKLTKTLGVSNPKLANLFCRQLPRQIQEMNPRSLEEVLKMVFKAIPAQYSAFISVNEPTNIVDLAAPDDSTQDMIMAERNRDLHRLLDEVQSMDLYGIVATALFDKQIDLDGDDKLKDGFETNAALATIFVLAAPREIFRTLPTNLAEEFNGMRDISGKGDLLKIEVERISDQLSSLMNDYCQCARKLNAYASLPSIRLKQQLQQQNTNTMMK